MPVGDPSVPFEDEGMGLTYWMYVPTSQSQSFLGASQTSLYMVYDYRDCPTVVDNAKLRSNGMTPRKNVDRDPGNCDNGQRHDAIYDSERYLTFFSDRTDRIL